MGLFFYKTCFETFSSLTFSASNEILSSEVISCVVSCQVVQQGCGSNYRISDVVSLRLGDRILVEARQSYPSCSLLLLPEPKQLEPENRKQKFSANCS